MAFPDPPADLDLTMSRMPEIWGGLISTWAIALIVVVLRAVARRLKGNPLWRDDYLIFVSFAVASVHVWTCLGFMLPRGFGKHILAGPADAAKSWAIGLFISEIAYALTILTVKWSTLSFYWRIFGSSPTIRLPIWVLFGAVTGWGIAFLFTSIFACVPPQAFWMRLDPVNPTSPTEYTCGVESKPFFIGISIPNIITDAMIVALPLPYVIRLHLPKAQKIALTGIFAIGAFVTIISVVRLVLILNIDFASVDITWNFSGAVIWSNLEGNIAIICSCLPSLKPLLDLALRGTVGGSPTRTGDNANKSGGGPKKGGGDRDGVSGGCSPPKAIRSLGTFTDSMHGKPATHTTITRSDSRGLDGDHPFVYLDGRDPTNKGSSFNNDDGGSSSSAVAVEMAHIGSKKKESNKDIRNDNHNNNRITVTRNFQVSADLKGDDNRV